MTATGVGSPNEVDWFSDGEGDLLAGMMGLDVFEELVFLVKNGSA